MGIAFTLLMVVHVGGLDRLGQNGPVSGMDMAADDRFDCRSPVSLSNVQTVPLNGQQVKAIMGIPCAHLPEDISQLDLTVRHDDKWTQHQQSGKNHRQYPQKHHPEFRKQEAEPYGDQAQGKQQDRDARMSSECDFGWCHQR